ncbi:MAG: CPBP family intramembrane glutamic endopeptidase [Gemmatimonadales bacterium]
MQSTNPPARRSDRWAAIELALVVLIVAAFAAGVLPITEVPALLILGWISLRRRGLRWSSVGLRRAENARRAALLIAAGVAYAIITLYTLDPLLDRLTGHPADLSEFADVRGNESMLVFWLLLSWLLGAFGEELAYRGYIMNRIADLVPQRAAAQWIAILGSAVLFGTSHISQGLSGVISNVLGGLVYGILYVSAGWNLWVPILAHGLEDTIGFLLIYAGRYPGL